MHWEFLLLHTSLGVSGVRGPCISWHLLLCETFAQRYWVGKDTGAPQSFADLFGSLAPQVCWSCAIPMWKVIGTKITLSNNLGVGGQ